MRCKVCKKEDEEVELFKGVLEDEMVMICEYCAGREGVPIIKKPTSKQLEDAEKRYSVRERMERMSGRKDTTEISPDQMVVQKNLARLRMPEKRQINDDVVYDYNWQIKIERRRRKMTSQQLGREVGIDAKIIDLIEQGKLPKNYKEILLKLESFLGVKLLKYHDPIITPRTKEDERKILEEVGQKMGIAPSRTDEEEDDFELDKYEEPIKEIAIAPVRVPVEKREKLNRISRGEVDFSRRMDFTNVTLNDLVEMKKAREKREARIIQKEVESEMMGDDIDLDLDEV
jgi:ribosome-binding protein aMBF1 (putative translation factor)